MQPENSASLIARCGLYGGVFGANLNEKCQGCSGNNKTAWYKVRECFDENLYRSCADCKGFPDPSGCPKLNNPVSRLISFFTRSDRAGCIRKIAELGYEHYAEFMSSNGLHSIKKRS